MANIREDPSGRPGYRSWVNDLRVGVDAEQYRGGEGLALDGPIMQRASEIATQELARGRTPKSTIKLEDVLAARSELEGADTGQDAGRVRHVLRRERYRRDR